MHETCWWRGENHTEHLSLYQSTLFFLGAFATHIPTHTFCRIYSSNWNRSTSQFDTQESEFQSSDLTYSSSAPSVLPVFGLTRCILVQAVQITDS